MKDKKNLKISIIIPTWNRKKKLLRLLNIIIAKFQKQKIIYEIIICDSFSTDGTQIAVSKNYGKNKNIRYENIKNNNISSKRNTGIKKSKFDNVLLLDDDCVPINNFFNIIKKYLLSSRGKNIFCGQYFTQKKLISTSNYYYFRDVKNLKVNSCEEINYKNIITGCCFFNKKNINKKLYFNEKIKGYGLEDVEWGFRLKKNNFRILLTEAKVDHQETSGHIGAYLIKWYILSRDAMPSLIAQKQIVIKGKMFFFEKIFKFFFIKFLLKMLNFLCITPLSIILKYYLIFTDKQKIFFSKNLFQLLLFIYYLRGASDRSKTNNNYLNWYKSGYK